MTHRIIRVVGLRLVALALIALALAPAPAAQESRRDAWQKVDEIFSVLGAVPGARIADVGAGDGFFTTRLSRAVGETGGVFAVDVSEESLERLRARLDREAIRNVQVIEGAYDDPRLPEGAIDGALIVNAYHEMDQHQAMLAGIAKGLRPGGTLVIVEPVGERYRDAERGDQTRRHEIAARFVLEDLRQAGFRVVRYEEEFARRPDGDTEWIIVATPRVAATIPEAAPPAEEGDARADWRSPSLRIDIDTARALNERGEAMFVDVRNLEMFEEGRLPGARLVPMNEVQASAASLAASGQRVIAYCS